MSPAKLKGWTFVFYDWGWTASTLFESYRFSTPFRQAIAFSEKVFESNTQVKQFTCSGTKKRPKPFFLCAPGWIRTNEGQGRQIYSLMY